MLKETNLDSITAIETNEINHFSYSFFAPGASFQGFWTYIRSVNVTYFKDEYK